MSRTYAVDRPLLEPCPASARRQAALPRQRDWVLDSFRRRQEFQLEAFPGLRDYYLTSDRLLTVAEDEQWWGQVRRVICPISSCASNCPNPRGRRRSYGSPTTRRAPGSGRVALMPAGSSARSLYPSLSSWLVILDALAEAFPDVQIALIGKRTPDARTATSLEAEELTGLLAHRLRPLDCFDLELVEQLAVVEACDLFLAPHTGFGLAALAVNTPWLALSGGRWFEYFFNRVPFRSIIPDTERYPSLTQFSPAASVYDGDDGPRTPSMSRARIQADLDRVVAAAAELLHGSLTYEQSLRDYFSALLAAHAGDATSIWSVDGVHLEYLPKSSRSPAASSSTGSGWRG